MNIALDNQLYNGHCTWHWIVQYVKKNSLLDILCLFSNLGFTYSESESLFFGHTGQFTNEALIYCGGKAKKGNLADCWEYDNIKNE